MKNLRGEMRNSAYQIWQMPFFDPVGESTGDDLYERLRQFVQIRDGVPYFDQNIKDSKDEEFVQLKMTPCDLNQMEYIQEVDDKYIEKIMQDS